MLSIGVDPGNGGTAQSAHPKITGLLHGFTACGRRLLQHSCQSFAVTSSLWSRWRTKVAYLNESANLHQNFVPTKTPKVTGWLVTVAYANGSGRIVLGYRLPVILSPHTRA